MENEIKEELYHSEDVYKTTELSDDNEYFEHSANSEYSHSSGSRRMDFYIPVHKMKGEGIFHPVDEQGNEVRGIVCDFDAQGACNIWIFRRKDHFSPEDHLGDLENHYIWRELDPFVPEILFHKGDKKSGVNARLIDSLQEEIVQLEEKFKNIIDDIDKKFTKFKRELDTSFVMEKTRDIALESVQKELTDVKLRCKDCKRLKSLIG